MKVEELLRFKPEQSLVVSPDVFQQIGVITRVLHDTMQQLGVMPQLQRAAQGLPDARSRLDYIAHKTAEAANKVLDAVDEAKLEQAAITATTHEMARALAADPVKAVASGAVLDFVSEVERRTSRIDSHLTDIMMAQDFHDLTGQVMAKVVTLANDLEDSLVKLLVSVAPDEPLDRSANASRGGPVVPAQGRGEGVMNQGEVDEMLASLGF